jgi:hypothetical protein
MVVDMACSLVSAGSMEGSRGRASFFPEPEARTEDIVVPGRGDLEARLAVSCPRTSPKSYGQHLPGFPRACLNGGASP